MAAYMDVPCALCVNTTCNSVVTAGQQLCCAANLFAWSSDIGGGMVKVDLRDGARLIVRVQSQSKAILLIVSKTF